MTINITTTDTSSSHIVSSDSQTTLSEGSAGSVMERFINFNLPYIAAGCAAVCTLCLIIVVTVVLWNKHRHAKSSRKTGADFADGVYVDITEATGGQRGRKKYRKKGQEIQVADNNNIANIELHVLGGLDAAPDIITAHDSESIYETLDGRRTARQPLQRGDNEQSSVYRLPYKSADAESTYDHLSRYPRRPVPESKTSAEEQLALNQQNEMKRMTDPEVYRRQNVPEMKPRNVHSANGASVKRDGGEEISLNTRDRTFVDNTEQATHLSSPAEVCCSEVGADPVGMSKSSASGSSNIPTSFPASNIWHSKASSPARIRNASPSGSSGRCRSSLSLAELARQSLAGGKRLVCQLTMVGVIENGKDLVRQPERRPGGNAYFVLEPAREGDDARDGMEVTVSGTRFRLCAELPPDLSAEISPAVRKASEYFTLEPLDDPVDDEPFDCAPDADIARPHSREDLQSIVDKDVPLASPNRESNSDSERTRSKHRIGSSFSGHDSASSFRDWTEKENRGRSQSIRLRRFSSCPTPSPPPEEDDEEEEDGMAMRRDVQPPLPPRNPSYRRSMSSQERPRRQNDARPERKMDAETLKARIREEMVALGFLDDLESGTPTDASAKQGPRTGGILSNPVPPGMRQPRNEYFILEPDAMGSNADIEGDDSKVIGTSSFPPLESPSEFSPPLPPRTYTSVPAAVATIPKPRFLRQQTTQCLPSSRLPRKGASAAAFSHARCRSETPLYNPDHRASQPYSARAEEGEEDQGPVVVSIKKSRSVDAEKAIKLSVPVSDRDLDSQDGTDPFRPRVKSESKKSCRKGTHNNLYS